ncbi:DUF4382 domain-containing protein [Marinobacter zhejiangensis]|uniref:DUF4382 domain-containing protein n=1 Tax=Marinobacter zhejiangensis TaxID=488535 RepID=A0A1I4MJA7_9GAMM|nr:DUF4382 domain-containing protein [Marinobacter zhejiangensis]SFM03126.1 protein of unknown function [Marinobacter zhejiangensis]
MNISKLKLATAIAMTSALAACGGGSDSGDTGQVSIGITDAPATEFSNVTIAFSGIALKPAGGKWIEFTFDESKTWNLLDLTGGLSEPLITNEEVPAGEYSELRLMIDTDNSFVALADNPDAQHTLAVPSGEQSGLKLKGELIVAADKTTAFTIDFDVAKSIVNPQGQSLADYLLKPSLRLVNNLEVGTLSGTVDYPLINQTRIDDDTLTNCADNYSGSVYVYAGADAAPTDLNVLDELDNDPLLVVPVTDEDNDGLYEYTAAFLPAGEYTISYSCQLDDNEITDTDLETSPLQFEGTQNVTVTANEDAQASPIPFAI